MDRRKFLGGAVVGTLVAAGAVVQGSSAPAKTKPDIVIPPGLTPLEQEMYREVHVEGYVCIPSRKMLRHTQKHWDQLRALKSLTFKGLIYWDVSFDSHDYVFMPNGSYQK